MTPLWLALPGCPWISPAEHQRDQRKLHALLDGDSDTDADADTDADVDTDVDTDADADLPCVDDAYEPNDSLLTVAPLTAPTQADGVVCKTDVSPVYGVPLDLFSVDLGKTQVLDLSLGGACDQLDLGLSVTDEAGNPYPDASAQGGCAQLSVGWGASRYLVWLTGPPDADQPYSLSVKTHECRDQDGDGYLAQGCGGPDCSDSDPGQYPSAAEVPLDGVDQDCDGGDELATGTCSVVLSSATVAQGALPCADLQTGAGWDRWKVTGPTDITKGLSVVVQNGSGAADLLAVVVGEDHTTHYGLDPDRTQLDDDIDCAQPAWTGETNACPAACVWNGGVSGTLEVWVAQHPGTGCTSGAEYTLVVYSDGNPVSPVADGDDIVFAP